MSKKMNNVVGDLGSDISDSGSDSDEEMVETDPVLLADVADMKKKVQGQLKKHEYQLLKCLNDAAKSTETVKNSKLKLKERFKAKSRRLQKCQQKLRDMEQSRDSWKKEAEERKVAEEGLKAENGQQALAIKTLNKESDTLKQEMGDMKNQLDTKLKDSESKYENIIKVLEEESKKLKQSNLQLQDKVTALDRAKRDLEANTKSLRLQLSNLQTNLQHITKEKDQVTVEKNEALGREKHLVAEVANGNSTIDQLVLEDLDRRHDCSTVNHILSQNKDHYIELLKKKKVSDATISFIMPESNCSSPQKRRPLSVPEDGTETGGKKRKATSRNSGHVSEEEGEIVNQQPQPQQETTALATQPITAPIPVVPIVGALPQIPAPRYIDNGASVNHSARQFQTTPNPITAVNTYYNRRNVDWSKHGGRGRKH